MHLPRQTSRIHGTAIVLYSVTCSHELLLVLMGSLSVLIIHGGVYTAALAVFCGIKFIRCYFMVFMGGILEESGVLSVLDDGWMMG